MLTAIVNRVLRVFSALLVLVIALTAAVSARADGELQVSVREASIDATGAARLLVKVVDRNGKPVRGLTPGGFTLKAGDKEIPVTGVQTATGGIL